MRVSVHVCMHKPQQQQIKTESMNFEVSKNRYMGGLGGKKGMGK